MRRATIGVLLAMGVEAASAGTPGFDLARLAFLEGTWEGTQGRTRIEETWSAADGGGMVGMHRQSRDGRMVGHEFFRILPTDSAGLVYLASPSGAAPTAFHCIELTGSRVVFENQQHDFPQRVIYWRGGGDTLHARIEGVRNGTPRGTTWSWTRRARE